MRLLTLILLGIMGCCSNGISQSSVFVLVDVSGSGSRDMRIRNEARDISKEIISGQFTLSKYNVGWHWSKNPKQPLRDIIQGKGKPLVDPSNDGFLMIMPFGVKNRYRDYFISQPNILPDDLNQFYAQHYPHNYIDNWTYIEIARAKAASLAKSTKINITGYYVIEITDNLSDTDSRVPDYTNLEQQLIDEYDGPEANEVRLATLRYKGDDTNYQIIFKKVDIQNVQIQITEPDSNRIIPKLEIIRPQESSKKNPFLAGNKVIDIVWRCGGCKPNTDYTVRVACTSCSNKPRLKPRKVKGNSTKITLEDAGTYRISVSAPKVPAARPAYIKIGSGVLGGGCSSGIPWLLFFGLIIFGLYRFFIKPRSEYVEESVEFQQDKKYKSRRSKGNNTERTDGPKDNDLEIF